MSFCLRPGHGDEGGQKKKKKKDWDATVECSLRLACCELAR